jgi:two-component system phosphate regulon sensor histidine kinase PhoR
MNETSLTLEKAGLRFALDQEQQPAIVLDNTALAILIFDAQAYLLFANPAGQKLFDGWEPEPGRKLLANSGYESLRQLLDKAIHSQDSLIEEIVWPDKRIFSAEISRVQAGSYAVVLYDVTRFKEREKLKNEFFATAVHDLRSPITSIIGFSHLLKAAGSLNASQSDFVQRVQQTALHMSELLEDILYLATFDLGAEAEKEAVDISRLLFEIAGEFQSQAALYGQLLVFEKTEPQVIVPGNEAQLRRMLRNLIGNAVKYTPEGGAITLSLEIESNKAKIRVRDTGYGIPASDLPYIFERFYRVRNNGYDQVEGNGLGLAIVKTIAGQHGGNVGVESEVGKGSRFTLTIPLFSAHPA